MRWHKCAGEVTLQVSRSEEARLPGFARHDEAHLCPADEARTRVGHFSAQTHVCGRGLSTVGCCHVSHNDALGTVVFCCFHTATNWALLCSVALTQPRVGHCCARLPPHSHAQGTVVPNRSRQDTWGALSCFADLRGLEPAHSAAIFSATAVMGGRRSATHACGSSRTHGTTASK